MTAPEMRKATLVERQAAFLKTSNNSADDTGSRTFKQRAKAAIVGAAVRGFIPPAFASWLLRRLGLVAE